jgi:hypothetical protein
VELIVLSTNIRQRRKGFLGRNALAFFARATIAGEKGFIALAAHLRRVPCHMSHCQGGGVAGRGDRGWGFGEGGCIEWQ